MGPFKTYTVTGWQVGLLKVSLIALGILIGSAWYEFFGHWIAVVWAVFLITAAGRVYCWWRGPAAAPGGMEHGGASGGPGEMHGSRSEPVAEVDRPRG